MAGSLNGPLTKLWRAEQHYMALAAIYPAEDARGRFEPLRHEFDADRREYRFYVGELEPIDTRAWSTLFGDALFNLRAALDQLVYELHDRHFRGNIPDDVKGLTQFPILTKPRLTSGKKKRVVPMPTERWREIGNLPARQRTTIQVLQPYVGRNDRYRFIRPVLARIQELNNIDKHRSLHIVRRAVTGVLVPTFEPADCGFRRTTRWGPIESNAEVDRWVFGRLPDNVTEQVDMHNHVVIEIVIDEGANSFGVDALLDLRVLCNYTWEVMELFRKYFPPVVWPAAVDFTRPGFPACTL